MNDPAHGDRVMPMPRPLYTAPASQSSAHLQVQREFGHDELIEAHAFGFRFAGQGGVERLGHAHVELAASSNVASAFAAATARWPAVKSQFIMECISLGCSFRPPCSTQPLDGCRRWLGQ